METEDGMVGKHFEKTELAGELNVRPSKVEDGTAIPLFQRR